MHLGSVKYFSSERSWWNLLKYTLSRWEDMKIVELQTYFSQKVGAEINFSYSCFKQINYIMQAGLLMLINKYLLTYTNHTSWSVKVVFLSNIFFFFSPGIIKGMDVCWDFRNMHSLNTWDNIYYGKDGEAGLDFGGQL